MDLIILIGAIIFGIGLAITALNTKVHYGFFTHYERRNKSVGWLGMLLIVIGLGTIILKAFLNGQLN